MEYDKLIEIYDACCPAPLIKTVDAVATMKEGEVLKVICSDKGYKIDIKSWCTNTGHILKDSKDVGENVEVYIEVSKKEEKPSQKNASSNTSSNNSNIPIKSIDCSGMQCPGPLLETKKAIDSINDGECVELISTDIGYAKDIEKWCANTGNTLKHSFTSPKKDKVTVQIIKGNSNVSSQTDTQVVNNKNATTMVCFSGDFDKLIATLIIANGAAAMGQKVSIFFTFWGLNALRRPKKVKKVKKTFMEKMFSGMMPRGFNKTKLSQMNFGGMGKKMIKRTMKKKNVLTLDQMFAEARNAGVEFIACTMSMDLMGIKAEELVEGCTLAGVGAYLGDATNSSVTLFI